MATIVFCVQFIDDNINACKVPNIHFIVMKMITKLAWLTINMLVVGIQVTDTVAQLDILSGYLHQRIRDLGLAKRLNVIHLSDHGMSNVSPPNFIDLRPFLKAATYTTYGTSPILQIVPNNSGESLIALNYNIIAYTMGERPLDCALGRITYN